MSTGQIKQRTNQNECPSNTRARSNKVTNNTKKQENNNTNQYNIQANSSKISLRNHNIGNGKKQSSNKNIQHNRDSDINDESSKPHSIVEKEDTISNGSFSQCEGESIGGKSNSRERKMRGQERQQQVGKGISMKNELKGNKIQFYVKNNNNSNNNNNGLFYEHVDNHYTANRNKLSAGNTPTQTPPNNNTCIKPPTTYTHTHATSSYNPNTNFTQINSNCQAFRKDTINQAVIPQHQARNKQDHHLINYNNNQPHYTHDAMLMNPNYHTFDEHISNTQMSNLKSFNSTSFTRQEFNGLQSGKNSNSSSFYDSPSLNNISTPINSLNSIKSYNQSSSLTPTNFHLKNNQNTQFNGQFFDNFSIEHIGQNNRLVTEPAKGRLQTKNLHYQDRNPSFHQNFTKHTPQNEHFQSYKPSFPSNLSSKPNTQLNSQSNLNIRNHQYGVNTQPLQRTKSHSKQYQNNNNMPENTQMMQTTPIYNRINFGIQTQSHYISKQAQIIKCQQNQHYNTTTNYFKQTTFKSANPYIVNMVSNFNKSKEKRYELDSIAEKDELGKVFVRDGNQRNSEFGETNQGNKYIQRQQQEVTTKNGKQKINVISDGSKQQYHPTGRYNQPNQKNNFTNLKYIKSPTNNELEIKAQYIQQQAQKVKNQDKYMKVNYQPLIRTQTNSQQSIKQNEKMQTQSVNTSFKKGDKSQTRSVHNYKKGRVQTKNTPYQNDQKQTSIRQHSQNKDEQNYNSKTNLHHNQHGTLPIYQRSSFFDELTPTKNTSQPNDSQSCSLGMNNNSIGQYQSNYSQQQTTGFNSSDSKQFVRSGNQHVNIENDFNGQEINIFGSKQHDLRPIQKSHFLQQGEPQHYRDSISQKKSIKKLLVNQSKGLYNNKTQILVSLNFKDLLKGENKQNRPNSKTLIQAITKNHFTKVFCTTFKIGQNDNGCDCVPKCYWVDQWMEIINNSKLKQAKSMMKNIDRNKLYNFGSQNMWKNKSNGQAMSFGDMKNTSNLNKDEIETFKQIEKDIPRTFSSHPTFKNQKFRDFLREVLIHSYYLDPKLGYVQGMNIITASIVYHSKTTEQALQLVDFVMHVLDYKKIYLNDMKKCRDLAQKTCQIIRINCYDMYNHVVIENEVDLEMFIVGWYFSMLGTFVPLEAMHFVINKFIQKQFAGIMKIIVTFFIFIKDVLMSKNDPNQIMQELSVQSMIDCSAKIDWNELISVSDKLKLTLDKQDL